LFFIILLAIFLRGFSQIEIFNLFIGSWKLEVENFFLPYGIVLFSLWGAALIPEVEEMLYAKSPNANGQMPIFENRKKVFNKIIVISILIPIIVYLFFIYLILGIRGLQTTESALTGLKNILGNGIVSLALLFGLLTTFTSFIALGLTLKKVFWYDLKINKNVAWFITCFLPLILFLIGLNRFIPVISFIGAVMLGIDGILILLMYRKLKVKSLLIYPLFLILLGGIIYQIIYFLK